MLTKMKTCMSFLTQGRRRTDVPLSCVVLYNMFASHHSPLQVCLLLYIVVLLEIHSLLNVPCSALACVSGIHTYSSILHYVSL